MNTGYKNVGFLPVNAPLLSCYVFYSQASKTIMESNISTAMFEIPRLSAQQGGLWECRVSTNGGQDSRKFNLTVKGLSGGFLLINNSNKWRCFSDVIMQTLINSFHTEPPVPTTPPELLTKSSKQLVVRPIRSHRGDGPIISTKILYKPVKNKGSWSSIIGKQKKNMIMLPED